MDAEYEQRAGDMRAIIAAGVAADAAGATSGAAGTAMRRRSTVPEPCSPIPSDPMRALRILVVEDEAVIATLLAEVLVGMGHDVYAIAASEADAVAAAVRCRPDLMIVDARLGEGCGVSAVEQILRSGFVAHLFVSGDAARVRAPRPDAVVLQKPFLVSDLAVAMEHALAAA
jgi:CheY-like chemotaxis protein